MKNARERVTYRSNNMLNTVALLLLSSCVVSHLNAMTFKIHADPSLNHKQKREVLFTSGTSIVKIVLGVSYPLETYDKVNYRTLNLAYNFQGQYMLMKPNATQYPWGIFKRSLQNQKEDYLNNKTVPIDDTRRVVYNAIKILMDRKGVNGKECLQRAICENAQSPIRITGIVPKILNLFLSPTDLDAEKCYIDAKKAGMSGTDCLQLYQNCPMGRGLFDSIFQFIPRFKD